MIKSIALRNIRTKLLAIIIFSLLTGLIVVGYIMYNKFKDYLHIQLEKTLREYSELVEQSLDCHKIIKPDYHYLKNFVDKNAKVVSCRITIIDKNGVVLGDSEIPVDSLYLLDNHLQRPEVKDARSKNFGFSIRHSATINKDLLYLCKAIRYNKQIVGYIRIAMFAEKKNRLLSDFLSYFIISALLIIFISGLFVIGLTFRININLAKLIRFAHDISSGKLDGHLTIHSNDELQYLANTLSEMAVKTDSFLRKLERRQQDLNTVLCSINEGLLAIDDNDKIIFFNDKIIKLIKIKVSKTTTKPYHEVIKNQHINSLLLKFFKKPIYISDEIRTEDQRIFEIVITPFQRSSSKPSGAVLLLRDITKFKNLEKIRRDFVANVSHEFKTPLSAIRGYSETLLDWGLEDNKVNKKYIQKIIKRSTQLENLVTDLLQLAHIERMQDTQLFSFSPEPIILDIIDEFGEMAKEKNIRLSTILPNTQIKIYGNHEMFHSIISNLIDNAIKYSYKGGQIDVSLYLTKDEHCIFAVADQGVGIPLKYQKRIFERFYRVDKARSRSAGGTGLGLSIVKHLADLQHAEVWVESKQDQGSCFYVKYRISPF